MSEDPIISVIAPHRGFNAKAREVLVGPEDMPLGFRGMAHKSNSDFDLRRKIMGPKKKSNTSSPSQNSQTSISSIPEQPVFDTIGDQTSIKRHLKLADIGKARSCAELKSDKRLLKTFQEENILKMPSIDSDIGSAAPPAQFDELMLGFEGLGKTLVYSATDKIKDKDNGKKNKK